MSDNDREQENPVPEKAAVDEDRRVFLAKCGRLAVITPPAMTVLLSTTLNSQAIAKSGGTRGDNGHGNNGHANNGHGDHGHGGNGHGNGGGRGNNGRGNGGGDGLLGLLRLTGLWR
jgi:hypothetical protein